MSDAVLTFIASVIGSGFIAALVSARAQRKTQFREGMLGVASDFAGGTMKALAALRRYKPPKPGVRNHRNEPLVSDPKLRGKRYEELQAAMDEVRGLRGRVRLHFPKLGSERSPVTVYADDIMGALRDASDACERFWVKCDAAPGKRRQLEVKYEARYQVARHRAWDTLTLFCNEAADWASRHEQGASLAERLGYRVGWGRNGDSPAVGSGADRPQPEAPHAPRDPVG